MTEPSHELRQQRRRLGGSDGPGTVRAPRHDPFCVSGVAEIYEWHVEHHYPKVGAVPPRRELDANLARSVASRIELHGAPAACLFRREPRGHVLPRETCAPGGPLVEEKTGGALSQGCQGWHLTLGHVPFGQGDFKAIKADSHHPVTRHPGTSLRFFRRYKIT